MPVPIRVMFFCLGNICRSPLAEGLFRFKVEELGLADAFHIESSGTSSYHVGELPDPGSRKVAMDRLGLDISYQRSQQLTREHLTTFDVLVAMDESNRRSASRLDSDAKIDLLRDWEPDSADRGQGVPDPWGGGGSHFGRVFDIVDRCCDELIADLVSRYDL